MVQGQKNTFIRGGQPKEIYVPLSDENCVVIPSNMKGTGFLKNLYKLNKPYLGGLINRQDFDNIIEGSAKITAMVYSHNRKKDVEGIPSYVMVSLGFSTILLLCFIFLLYYGIRDEDSNTCIAGFFTLGVSVFITMVIGVVNFFSRPDKYTPFKEMVRKALLKYFVQCNKEYVSRGLEFDVRDNHYWIEIKINRNKAETFRRQIHYDANHPSDSEENPDNIEEDVGPTQGNDNLFTAAREEDGNQLVNKESDLF